MPIAAALECRLQLEQLLLDAAPEVQARNYNGIAYLGVHTGQLIHAERAARSALDLYAATTTTPDGTLATYTFMLAAVLAQSRKFDGAARYGETAVELYAGRVIIRIT